MTEETYRKLNLMARIEQTIATGLRDTLDRADSDEIRARMVRLASSHEWHSKALLGIEGVEGTHTEKVDREMATLLQTIERPREYGAFMDTLSNVEREQSTRIAELLGSDLDEQIEQMLIAAQHDIDVDASAFLAEAAALGYA